MSDIVFFPITVLVALALIGAALVPVMNRKPSGSVSYSIAESEAGYRTLVIEGDELYKIVAGGQSEIELVQENGQTVLQIAAGAGMLPDDPVKGPHFRMAADVENVLSGRRIRVTVTAKPMVESGASEITLNYSTGREGESGWITRGLMPDYSEVSFDYQVPQRGEDLGVDYLAIRPVVPEKTRGIVVRRIVIIWGVEGTS